MNSKPVNHSVHCFGCGKLVGWNRVDPSKGHKLNPNRAYCCDDPECRSKLSDEKAKRLKEARDLALKMREETPEFKAFASASEKVNAIKDPELKGALNDLIELCRFKMGIETTGEKG